ncbi:hypothetical protein [Azorhizobium doebereinerae]|uniref:hypothetical protein n=1 Tax=Azorhizobium doebereinerae TaxID=281091 RepID=UPI0004288E77|nr:hypothetical protein [Azorhizobium doebereinerae]
MDSYGWLLTRLLVVSAGLAVAILAGSLVAAYGISVTPLPMVSDIWIADAGLALAARNPPFLVLVAACLAQIVTIWKIALIGVVATEVLFLRSWMFQAANGAASGFLASHLYTLGLASGLPVVSPDHMLTAGLVGGLAYWGVAGWNAGFRTPSFELPPAI